MALPTEVRHEKETKLLNFLNRFGLVNETATLDDILNLKVEDLLERRLQTIVMKKTAAKSPYSARQIVVHGHVSMGNRKVNIPGYFVKKEEESQILLHISLDSGANVGAPSVQSAASALPDASPSI